MKKNLEKIFASCSIVVAFILIMVLVVTAFGGVDANEFNSKLVRGLIITLAILYLVLAIISLVLIFVNSDVVKEITLRQEKGGSVRVSSNVITKFVKTTCKQVEGVKCQKVALVSDEYGVRLKTNVKVVDKDVLETETYLRTLLEDVFLGEFGFKFSSIEIKVMALTPNYKADQAAVQAKVEKKLAEMKAQEEKNAQNEQSEENVENVESVENAESAEQAEVQDGEAEVEKQAEETVEVEAVEDESQEVAQDEAVEDEVENGEENVESVESEEAQTESDSDEKAE